MKRILLSLILFTAVIVFTDVAFAQEAASSPTGVVSGNLWQPTIRMILGLIGVLAVLGAFAYLANRLKRGTAFKSGMIEVVSGISLGSREKVVLLRVGADDILVGVTPGGMCSLHVMTHAEPANFDEYFEATQVGLEKQTQAGTKNSQASFNK